MRESSIEAAKSAGNATRLAMLGICGVTIIGLPKLLNERLPWHDEDRSFLRVQALAAECFEETSDDVEKVLRGNDGAGDRSAAAFREAQIDYRLDAIVQRITRNTTGDAGDYARTAFDIFMRCSHVSMFGGARSATIRADLSRADRRVVDALAWILESHTLPHSVQHVSDDQLSFHFSQNQVGEVSTLGIRFHANHGGIVFGSSILVLLFWLFACLYREHRVLATLDHAELECASLFMLFSPPLHGRSSRTYIERFGDMSIRTMPIVAIWLPVIFIAQRATSDFLSMGELVAHGYSESMMLQQSLIEIMLAALCVLFAALPTSLIRALRRVVDEHTCHPPPRWNPATPVLLDDDGTG